MRDIFVTPERLKSGVQSSAKDTDPNKTKVERSRLRNFAASSQIRQALTKQLQRLFWIYLTKNFVINSIEEVQRSEPTIECSFVPITFDNYVCVSDFRQRNRIVEYHDKLAHGELGYFTEYKGKMIASIWATINTANKPRVVRGHMRIAPNEALVHDIVTGEHFRGMGVGPFMVYGIATALLNDHGVDRIIIDVNSRNIASLRMMDKVGLKVREETLSISILGRWVFQKAIQ
jgi:RimJ/RimL family protein N-acetyltransferase